MRSSIGAFALLAGGLAGSASGQTTLEWPVGEFRPYVRDSGFVAAPEAFAPATAWVDVVSIEDAGWLRLYFGDLTQLEPGSYIRVTSLFDDEVQTLDAAALAKWKNTTAYFNGDAVMVELVASPGTAVNRLVLEEVAVQLVAHQPIGGPGTCGICGSDTRIPSSVNWTGRLLPFGCTASVWNQDSCLVSAGHCISGTDVIEFNVPSSNPNCSLNHPPVIDQFPTTDDTFINGGVGNDWAVMTCGTNGSGQKPYERYGELRPLASSPGSVGQAVSVTGYGVDQTCTLSQTQQFDAATISSVSSTFYTHSVDTVGGNSGSAFIHNDEIIGIVTHCPCPNIASRIDIPAFAAAREALCAALEFSFPGGLPGEVDPAGGQTVDVVVSGAAGNPEPGTGMFHLSIDGGPFVATLMTEGAANEYEATFPATTCPAVLAFYFSAESESGSVTTSPDGAPSNFYSAVAALSAATAFDDDFETDQGWTVEDGPGLSDGTWTRGIPVGDGDRGDPATDADGSGQCYLTDNVDGDSDVDGGATTLVSPVMDLTSFGDSAVVSYYRWFSNDFAGNPFEDIFVVEVSDDGGASWENLETVGPTGPEASGGWFFRQFNVTDAGIGVTSQFQIRFTASDTGGGSIVEAGIDGVHVQAGTCGVGICPWDCDGSDDGIVGVDDFLAVLSQWGMSGTSCHFAGAGAVGIDEFLDILGHWGPCPVASLGPQEIPLPVSPKASSRR